MATRLTSRPLSRANITIDESDKINIYPIFRPSAGEVFGIDAERDARDEPTQDRTNDFSVVCLMLAFAAGVASTLIIAACGWAIGFPR